MLGDSLSAAGCNDMDQLAFSGMDVADMTALKVDFDEWDRRANPDGYEGPKPFEWVSDFEWNGFIIDRLRRES